MAVIEKHTFAVITGDLVGFKKFSPNQRALLSGVINHTYQQVQEYFQGSVIPKIDVFRGDSWQFIIKKPELSLRIVLFFRALMISQTRFPSIDTRTSIGIGNVDYLPSKNIPTGDGEAFRQSGYGLDTMPRNLRMRIESTSPIGTFDITTINILLQLIDAIVKDWTSRQAYVVCGAILGLNQAKIASTWLKGEISQQAVAQHLERAKWTAISDAINHFEDQWEKDELT